MKVVPPSLDTLLDDENDDDYKQRSRTPPQTGLSLMWKSVTKSANAETHLQGAWDTTLWAGR